MLDIWTKRVSRVITLGDSLKPPKPKLRSEVDEFTLAQIMFKALLAGKLIAYSTVDPKFTYPLSRKAVQEIIDVVPPDTVEVEDVDGTMLNKVIKREIPYGQVRKYRVLEEWTFDIKKATTTIQIIGIAPFTPPKIMNRSGAIIGDYPMFWVKYEDAKNILIDYQQSHPDCNVPLSVWESYFTETQ
jgi:hypothetical protein